MRFRSTMPSPGLATAACLTALLLAGCADGVSAAPTPRPVLDGLPPQTGPSYQPEHVSSCPGMVSAGSELNADYSKCLINVAPAYARDLDGDGVTVAVLGSGLTSVPHQELPADRITEVWDWRMGAGAFHLSDTFGEGLALPNPDIPSGETTGTLEAPPLAEYGVAIASLIGGERDSMGIHGVAYEATVQMFNIQGLLPRPEPEFGENRPDSELAQELQIARQTLLPALTAASANADIVNINLDTSSDFDLAESAYTPDFLRQNLGELISFAAQAETLPADRTIYVWSAGNPAVFRTNASLLSALPARIPELRGLWVSVVSVDENGRLDDTVAVVGGSPQCGLTAAQSCLAAPGTNLMLPAIRAIYPVRIDTNTESFTREESPSVLNLRGFGIHLVDGESIDWSTTLYQTVVPEENRLRTGVSFYNPPRGGALAAPLVSGALALMKQAFPGMSSVALVNRLLATANDNNLDMLDDGQMNDSAPNYGDQRLYGRGLLNIGAAVTPIGMTSLAAGGLSRPVNTFFSRSDNAQGLLAALAASLPAGQVMVQDSLGAPFWQPLASLPGVAPAPTDLSRQHDVSYWSRTYRSGRWHSKQLTSADALGHVSTGYVLDNRAGSGSGSFLSLNVAPAYLTGLQSSAPVSGLRAGEFSSASFAAPWAGLLSGSSYGGGISFRAGRGIFTAAGFQSETSSPDEGGTGRRQLLLSEYRLSANHATLLLQSGQLQESAGWQGLNTEASVYGAFSSRSAWQSITGLTALSKRWHLAASARQGQIALSPLTPGLLSAISGLRTHNLELGVLKRRVLTGDDSLSLKWSQQRIAGTAQWYLPAALHHDTVLYAGATTSLGQSQTVFQARYQVAAGPQTRLTMQWTQLPNLPADGQLSWSLTHKFSAL